MRGSLLRHELRSRLGAILGWSLGLAAFGSFYVAIFPEISEKMTDLADLSIYRTLALDMSSFAGFIASSIVQFTAILLGVYAILTGTDTLAGEEDRGTLELLLAMPVRRAHVVSSKAGAMIVSLVAILVVSAAIDGLALHLVVGRMAIDVGVTPLELGLATLSGLPLAVAFAMIGLFFGAYLPTRRAAASATTVVFVASYFAEILGRTVGWMGEVARFSPFTYFDTSGALFTEGVRAGDVGVLLGVAAIFCGLALLAFERRNVTTKAWPWSRPREG